MKGSIRKKANGRWYVVTHHRDHATGKQKQKAHGGYGTKREAETALREVLTRMDRGTFIEPSKLTLGQFLTDEWLPSKRGKRPSTFDSYRRNVENHIIPAIGHVPLQKVTPGVLRSFYADLETAGRRNGPGGGLAPKTIRHMHTSLHNALRMAEGRNLIARNPAANEDGQPIKRSDHEDAEMATWTGDELRRFLAHASTDRLYAAFHLAATTGMRRGEILGLRWADVNLDRAQLTIRQTVTSVAYELHIGPPKTKWSRRSFAIDQGTAETLRAHRKRQAEERLAYGPGYADTGLVFAREDGTVQHPDRFSQIYERLRNGAGVSRIRFHDIRHTYATLALQAGMAPKTISERLGHRTVAFTMDVYTHAIPAMDAEAADLFARMVLGGNGTTG